MSIDLAIVATHPIQYQIPWFQELSKLPEVKLRIYYALLPDKGQQGAGFGVPFVWDIPMLEGYEWVALANTARKPSLSKFFGSRTPSIKAVLSQNRPDAVIITGWNAYSLLQALWACMILRIPRIVRGESNALCKRPPWIRLLHRALLSCFDAFLAIGNANQQFYLQNGVESARIFDSKYFVDNHRIHTGFELAVPKRAALREKWGIPCDRFCFLYVGKLEPKKRIFDLLAALRMAMRTSKDLHLLVVGAGELGDEAKAMSEAGDLPVSYAGFLNQTELPDAYAAGDCLTLPSDYGETWGLVVNEAMVCGLPAIVSDRVGCGPDLIEQGVTGAIFPFGNVTTLAARLVEMASDRSRAQVMGRRARERVSCYSVKETTAGTLRAVEFVLHKRT
jgi:glycosyltransferase involved in cell wall biosynthesis